MVLLVVVVVMMMMMKMLYQPSLIRSINDPWQCIERIVAVVPVRQRILQYTSIHHGHGILRSLLCIWLIRITFTMKNHRHHHHHPIHSWIYLRMDTPSYMT